MKILLGSLFGSYIDDDIYFFLKSMGYDCMRMSYLSNDQDRYNDDDLVNSIEKDLKEGNYDCLYTTNFWPLAALAAHNAGIPYISWSYDSPPNLSSEKYMDFDTNYIYFFSKDDVENYRNKGLNTVFHMPLAVNTNRWDEVTDYNKYRCDVAFIGSLYRSTLPTLKTRMNEYQKAYVDAVIDNQRKIYKAYVVDQLITDKLTDEICQTYREIDPGSIQPSRKQLIYSVASHVSYLDRMTIIKLLGDRYNTHFYTDDINKDERRILSSAKIHGKVDYLTQMPKVFKGAKINLAPTFRGNCSGIPLRVLDIMGCNSFALCSYQPEIEENFKDGRDVVMYTSIEECIDKTDYYIKHDSERIKISENAYNIVKKEFNYTNALKKMFNH